MTASYDTLYKYRKYSAYSLEMLINRELYFASSIELNDPYDCQINIAESLCSAISDAEKNGNKDLSSRLEKLQKINPTHNNINEDVASVGVLSLSRVSDSTLMWAHYANNHEGFCIGFNLSEDLITYNQQYQIIGAANVEYVGANPFKEFFETSISEGKQPEWQEYWQSLFCLGMTTKAEHWHYENEVRVLRKEKGTVPFHPSELTEIIFGLNMPQRQKFTIRKILSDREWSHVQFKEVSRSNGFALSIKGLEKI